jgi:RND family efflux transporter MFP subunit
MKKYIWIISGLLVGCCACHHHDHSAHDHAAHGGHDHGKAAEGHSSTNLITYTLQQENIEVFAEFAPLVAGQRQVLEITLTQLQPLKALSLPVSLVLNEQVPQKASSTEAGIYRSELHFEEAGVQQLTIRVRMPERSLNFSLPPLPVSPDVATAKQAVYPQQDEEGSITFARQKMWNDHFELVQVQKRPVGQIIHTSGSIEPATSNLVTMVARRDGVVSLRKKNMTSGTPVRRGELLFSVAGKGIVSDNLEMNYVKAQSNLERQEANLARKRQLLDDQIIGQKEYDEALNSYQVVEAEFKNVQQVFNKGSKRHLVTAPNKGFISQISVQEGAFVEAGQKLGTLLQTSRLQVRVDISPRYGSWLPLVMDANFINPYSEQAYSLASLEGQILSFGKMTSHAESHYLPLYFEINNHPDLLPGTLVEVYLMTQPNSTQLVVPKSAVLEEMGSQVVFVQRSANSYDKQVVKLGLSDGEQVQVLEGLSEGDYVVGEGALRIKLAAMTGTVDPHAGHQH